MSKELEALEVIKHTTDLDRPNELNGYHNEIDTIEKALKALEIIKEHWTYNDIGLVQKNRFQWEIVVYWERCCYETN